MGLAEQAIPSFHVYQGNWMIKILLFPKSFINSEAFNCYYGNTLLLFNGTAAYPAVGDGEGLGWIGTHIAISFDVMRIAIPQRQGQGRQFLYRFSWGQ